MEKNAPQWLLCTRGRNVYVMDEDGNEIAQPFGNTPEERAANARLIVAAPKMEVLLSQMAFVLESVAHLQGRERELLPLTDAAREVLAQIRGTKEQ